MQSVAVTSNVLPRKAPKDVIDGLLAHTEGCCNVRDTFTLCPAYQNIPHLVLIELRCNHRGRQDFWRLQPLDGSNSVTIGTDHFTLCDFFHQLLERSVRCKVRNGV